MGVSAVAAASVLAGPIRSTVVDTDEAIFSFSIGRDAIAKVLRLGDVSAFGHCPPGPDRILALGREALDQLAEERLGRKS